MKVKLTKHMPALIALLLAAMFLLFFFMGTGLGKENFVQIKSKLSKNDCINVSTLGTVYMGDCGREKGQQWSIDGTPEDVYHKVRNEQAGKNKCLTINPNIRPKRVYMGNCDGAEKWSLKDGKLQANTIMYGVPDCLSYSGKGPELSIDACARLKPQWLTRANN